MAVELRFTPEAAQDIADAFKWYEHHRLGLGLEFANQLNACIEATLRNPKMHRIVRKGYRRSLLRRFPYAVFYECEDNLVMVYCIVHTSRNPAIWQGRLP